MYHGSDCTAALTLPVLPPGGQVLGAAFVASEVNGTWSAVQAVPSPIRAGGPPPPDGIVSLSCWAPGDCLAGGFYNSGGNILHTMVALQQNGTWANLNFTEIPGITNLISYNASLTSGIEAVSCSDGGACSLGGFYHDKNGNQQVFDAARNPDGSFFAQTLPGSAEINAAGDAAITDMSCAAPGDCAVSGSTSPDSGNQRDIQALVDVESGGSWASAQEIEGIANLSESSAGPVSCGGTGDCVTGGWFFDTAGRRQAFRANEFQHRWGGASEVAGDLNTGGNAQVSDVSCAFFGNCTIGGFYTDAAGHQQGFVDDESTVTTTALALTSGNVAAGNAAQEHFSVTVAGATGGTPTGTVTVKAGGTKVCDITLANGKGDCTLAAANLPPGTYAITASYSGDGTYIGSSLGGGHSVHVLAATAKTSARLGLSAAKATFGHEQAEQLSVAVAAQGQAGDTPSGKVTFKAGGTALGTATLTDGKATLTLGANKLRPGTYKMTASYGGDLANSGSASGGKTLTVAAEPTSTALTLSAPKVKAGHEQSEKLSVQVKPKFSGTPTGKVTVRAGSAKVCVITLKGGKGSCTLKASQLRAGTYQLTASYAAVAPFAGSASGKKTLTVTK